MLHDSELAALARYARGSIREALGGAAADAPRGGVFEEPGATFVTLHQPDGSLQGCIGCLEAQRPLWRDVHANALAAAFKDPRGRRLARDDVDGLEVEVSVLSAQERIDFDGSEESARAALRPGVDGVVLSVGDRRGTFLPQVWDELPDPKDFLDHLKAKASLPQRFWSREVALHRYTVQKGADPSRTRGEVEP